MAPPRLWDGDEPTGYDLLQAQISGSLGPKDFLEEIWTRDGVDLVWEIFRLRRIKNDLMREGDHKGVLKVCWRYRCRSIVMSSAHWCGGDSRSRSSIASTGTNDSGPKITSFF